MLEWMESIFYFLSFSLSKIRATIKNSKYKNLKTKI